MRQQAKAQNQHFGFKDAVLILDQSDGNNIRKATNTVICNTMPKYLLSCHSTYTSSLTTNVADSWSARYNNEPAIKLPMIAFIQVVCLNPTPQYSCNLSYCRDTLTVQQGLHRLKRKHVSTSLIRMIQCSCQIP